MRFASVVLIASGWAFSALGGDVSHKYEALYDAIMVRDTSLYPGYTDDPVAPLIWKSSRFLVEDESKERFLSAINDFASLSDAEIDELSHLQRAILQRHLWAVFDVSFDHGSNASGAKTKQEQSDQIDLQKKIAVLLDRIALTETQIGELPDTYLVTLESGTYPDSPSSEDPFQPFYPVGLFDEDGEWICLARERHPITGKAHVEDKLWRSVFHVFIKLPGGRVETLQYIEELRDFRDSWTTAEPEKRMQYQTLPHGGIHDNDIFVNPETPQFPVGTKFALVEQALLIDDNGEILASPLFLEVQMRHYFQVAAKMDYKKPVQAVSQFVIQPRAMMKGDFAMRAFDEDEKNFRAFGVSGDQFENSYRSKMRPGPRLKSCMSCHDGWGIHSVLSRSQLFETTTVMPPRFVVSTPDRNVGPVVHAKKQDYSWGFLQGLWQN